MGILLGAWSLVALVRGERAAKKVLLKGEKARASGESAQSNGQGGHDDLMDGHQGYDIR